MHVIRLVILVALSSVINTQDSTPVLTPTDFTGHYQFSWEPEEKRDQMTKSFPHFVQFDILDPHATGKLSRMTILVCFFASSESGEDDSLIRCYHSSHLINTDSLFFSTLQCSSERYDFKGHFLTHVGEATPPTIQIEGILSYYRGSTLKKKAHVQFPWIAGC